MKKSKHAKSDGNVREVLEKLSAETATGCMGAGNYRDWAREHGFPFLEVVDWTSSAGDWTFIVSIDGKHWQVMTQTNNYPRAGFSYTVVPTPVYRGNCATVLAILASEA